MANDTTIQIPTVPLHDGGEIPQVGTGTLFAKGNELADLLARTIRDGYRLLDTAAQYANEGAVGEAITSTCPESSAPVRTEDSGRNR